MADPAADLSRGPVLLSFSLATACFAIATTFARFYVRWGKSGGFGADDYASGAATVLALSGTIFSILESTASDPARALQFKVIGQPWPVISATLSKISICLFFMGPLRGARHWRILLAGLIVGMAVINLASVMVGYLQCRPLEKTWNPVVVGACADPSIQANFGYAHGVFSVFTWVFLSLFPILMIREVPRSQPTGPLYATSALSFVSGIFVIVWTAQTSQTSRVSTYTTHFFYASLMATLEQNLSLTTSNLLSFGPLYSGSSMTSGSTGTRRTTTTSTSNSTRRRHHHRTHKRRDPYSSASSAGTSHSSRKRTLTSASARSAASSRAGSTRSINRLTAADNTRASSRASGTVGDDHDELSMGRESNRGDEIGIEIDRKRTTHLIIEGPGLVQSATNSSSRRGGVGGSREAADSEGDEYDLGERSRRGEYMSSGSESDSGRDEGYGYGSDEEVEQEGNDIGSEAWPRGIIKTVSVEVVEEVNEEYVAAAAAAAKNNTNRGGVGIPGGAQPAANTAVGQSSRVFGRNSISVGPGIMSGRQPRVLLADNAERVSGGSGIEQDWETMLKTGPPR